MAEEYRQVVIALPGSAYGVAPPKEVDLILMELDVAAGATTGLGDCATIDLSQGASSLMLTVYVEYHAAAVAGARIHVVTAPVDDPGYYDSVDWDHWDVEFLAGAGLQQSHNYETCPAFIRVLVENLDVAEVVHYIDIIATVGR